MASNLATSSAITTTYRSILTNTGVYSIAIIASKMASFLLLPVYTRCLTTADYGILELLDLTSFVCATLVGAHFSEALFYFYPAATNPDDRDRTVGTCFLGAIIVGIVGGLLGWAASPLLSDIVFGSKEYTRYFHLVFLAFLFSGASEAGLCYCRALNRSRAYVIACCVRLACSICSNLVLLVWLHMGPAGVLWSSVISSFVMMVGMAVYIFRRVSLKFSFRLFGLQFRYAVPLGLGGLGMLIIHFGDRYFLRQYVSLSEIGIYSLAYKLGMLISYCQAPFEIYWRAQVFHVLREEGGGKTYVRVCTYMALGLLLAFIALSLFAWPLLHAIAAPEFHSAARYVPWVALAYLIRGVGGYFRNVLIFHGSTTKDARVTWIGSLVCLGGYISLIPTFKLWGAVAATVVAFSVILVVGYIQAQALSRFDFEYRRLAILGGLACAVLLVCHVLGQLPVWPQLAVAVVSAAVSVLAVFLVGFFKEDEKLMMRVAVQRIVRNWRGAGSEST